MGTPRWRGATTACCATPRSKRCGGPSCRSRAAEDSAEAFGLSFYLYRRAGRTIVGHTGEQSGFRTFFYLDPVSTTAVIGVLNTTNEVHPEASNQGWDRLTHRAVELVAP